MDWLIDSHCHLTFDELAGQLDGVIERAKAVGVGEFVTVATDLADAEKALALSARHPEVHVAAGIHPHEAGKAVAGWDDALRAILRRPDVYAVGEIGLDYHYDFSDRPSQMRVFRRQLDLAVETGKPVVIHCREAHPDLLGVLGEYPAVSKVVFHCFSGTRAQAAQIVDRGYWLSLTGVVTFKRSDELRQIAREVPADRLLLETDAPYLSPEPVRHVRPNEPAFMVHTAACVARERGLGAAEFASLMTDNTRRFFNLPVGEPL
jgi:TatD DNase family protein